MASHVARPVEAVREGFLEEVDPTCVRSHRQREPYWQRGSRGDVSLSIILQLLCYRIWNYKIEWENILQLHRTYIVGE